jgi:Protein of unknown function (DUF499)
MKLKPWFHVVTPREDLREGKPLDASEFAVNLEDIRDGRARKDYQEPARFFERTYLTRNLKDLAAQAVRRLSGIEVETSPVFNMATQFGGGKTHTLALLYHLAQAGPNSHDWQGVRSILDQAQVKSVPKAATAVFVGQKFDSIHGRGGTNGEPRRCTPWGEIAWQIGGAKAFAIVAQHDEEGIAPGGDAIRAFLPDGPALILMDELMNYVSRERPRKGKLGDQLYNFIQNLSEEARGRSNVVLCVSIPASELEMNAEDQGDFDRFKKMLDRLGKAVIMSAETETAEIIRRRLFDWSGLPDDARATASAYAIWVIEHKQMVGDFDVDSARDRFLASYPFHPALLSVFERKWQSLPRFQRTRGVLRLLALWVSHAYKRGFEGAHLDPLIGLGTAPLEDAYFRAALFEQLGNNDLEGPVTTDIAGKKEAHALRLDREAEDAIKKTRLHQKAATVILFESNGGQTKTEATTPEIRLAVAEPNLDIGNVETALDSLSASCYYLTAINNRYRFSLSPNLNKILTDRRATIGKPAIEERVKQVIVEVFKAGPSLARAYFPEKNGQVPDQPALTLVIMPPNQAYHDPATHRLLDQIVRDYNQSGRTFKSALFFAVPDSAGSLQEEARRLLACEDISGDVETYKRLDDIQRRQLDADTKKAARDLKETVWRTYNHVVRLVKDNTLQDIDFGLVHSSAAGSMTELILNRLRSQDEVTENPGASKLVKYWPPALKEWTTKAARDAFFSSPALPRLLKPDAIKRTIADGINQKLIAYAGKSANGGYEPFLFEPDVGVDENDIEISEEMVLLKAADAILEKEPARLARIDINPASAHLRPGESITFTASCFDQHGRPFEGAKVAWAASGGAIDQEGRFSAEDVGDYRIEAQADSLVGKAEARVEETSIGPGPIIKPPDPKGFAWQGTVPPQKWMNFYTKVLSSLVSTPGLKLEVRFAVPPGETATEAKIEATRAALRDLGLAENVTKTDF